MVRWSDHADIEGQPCTGKDALVENTLRVKHEHRIVLWFMGTAEESRVLRQFWAQVRYVGCSLGAEESEGAIERTLGRGTLSGHNGVILIVNRIRKSAVE